MQSLQAILFFDLDNTLVKIENSHHFFDNIIVEVFNEYCIPPPSKEERDQLWRNSDYKLLLKSWNFPEPVIFWKSFDKLDLEYRKILFNQGQLTLFDDILPTLQKLTRFQGIYNILLTNSSWDITKFELDIFGMNPYFQKVLALGDTQDDCKPDPKRILEIIERLSFQYKFDRNQVYIIGDSLFDISAGKNANIRSILIERREKIRKHWVNQPDYIIENMDQLFSILHLA